MNATIIAALCALTSLLCTVLLARGYRASQARLLLWSAISFGCFTLTNLVLVADLRIPSMDLSLVRLVPTALGLSALLYGLVWESR